MRSPGFSWTTWRIPTLALLRGWSSAGSGYRTSARGRVDDVHEPKHLESAMPAQGTEPVDASGLYCCLTAYDRYAGHAFQPHPGWAFGPEVHWELALRRQGYSNFIDSNVAVEHLRADGTSVHSRTMAPVLMRLTQRGRMGGKYPAQLILMMPGCRRLDLQLGSIDYRGVLHPLEKVSLDVSQIHHDRRSYLIGVFLQRGPRELAGH
jgi:hypothetical protein